MDKIPETRRRSPFWSHFQRLDGREAQQKKAICNYCAQILAGHCTGNLSRHLRQKHPEIMAAIEEAQLNMLRATRGYDTNINQTIDEENHSSSDTGVFVLSVGGEEENNQFNEEQSQEYEANEVDRDEVVETKVDANIKALPDGYPKTKTKRLKKQRSDESQEDNVADRFDIFGTLVAVKMRGLNRDQMIIAEKLINDTLHEAEMNNLNFYTKLDLVQVHMIDENP